MKRARYNSMVTRGRVIVENAIGRLRMRFAILQGKCRIKKHNFKHVFLTCVALSNFFNETGSFIREEDVVSWRTARQMGQ